MTGLALLGAGRMAKVHAEAISAADARLVTVFDVAEAAAASLASKTGASLARTAEEALSHPEVTAVLVATSSDTHVKYVIDAVQAGKAVMCEKPLASTLSEAQQCVDALREHAGKVFLAFNRRFDPGHAAVKKVIEHGEIGNLEQLTITSRDPYPPPLEAFLNGLAQGQSASVNAIDGLRAVYLAEAAGASLRLEKAIQLKPNCEITWQ